MTIDVRDLEKSFGRSKVVDHVSFQVASGELVALLGPSGALDAKVRIELREWIRTLHKESGITSVFVTHDQEEAMDLADRVVILHRGKIEQIGTPEEIYDRPATELVASFVGSINVLRGAGAIIERMSRVGWMVKLELRLADGQALAVEIAKDRVAELGLVEGDRVLVSLKDAKVFVQDYAI